MPAAVYLGDGEIAVRELDVPELGAGDVLVEVSHCGICGTDLHLVLEQYARPGSVLGHEWAGTIAAVGADVHGWEIGARVVQNPTPGCGECRACRRGRPSVCLRREPPDLLDFTRGAFCRYKVVPAVAAAPRPRRAVDPRRRAHRTDRDRDPHGQPLGRRPRRPRARHRRRPGRPAHDRGAARPRHRRHHRVGARAVAARAGARGRRGARDRARRRWRARRWAGRSPSRTRIAFECSGNAAAAESAFDQLDYAGTLVFVGTGHDMPRINHNRAIVLELTIIAAYNYDIEGFAPALELLASGGSRSTTSSRPTTCCSTTCSAPCTASRPASSPGKVMVRPGGAVVTRTADFAPRLNHVAISMDPALLDDRGRAELLDFYGDVFGWTEGDNTGETGNPLIMYTGAFGQFVYLLPGDPYLQRTGDGPLRRCRSRRSRSCRRSSSRREVARRERRAGHGDRRARSRTTQGPTADYTLTSAYIGFVMPLLVELQHLERHERKPTT